MIGAFNAIEKVHPVEEHHYLEALGTRQDMQSKGAPAVTAMWRAPR